jgi:hypothetical protein
VWAQLGHTTQACSLVSILASGSLLYGEWLKASHDGRKPPQRPHRDSNPPAKPNPPPTDTGTQLSPLPAMAPTVDSTVSQSKPENPASIKTVSKPLPASDKNTKYFHSRATQRKRKNTICSLLGPDNIRADSDDAMASIVDQYFQDLFTLSHPTPINQTIDCMEPTVTASHNSQLLQTYSAEEIKKAIFQMHPSKSPGPDGMIPFFFQKYWHIIGDDVISAVLSFLKSGHLLRKLNYTHIVLIPKIPSSQRVSDFRPISLCNVIYKIISKVLVNRLQGVLPQIILDA